MSNKAGGGLASTPVVIFIVFLILKLTGVIAWSWWWVTAPLWGSFALIVLLAVCSLIYMVRNSDKYRHLDK